MELYRNEFSIEIHFKLILKLFKIDFSKIDFKKYINKCIFKIMTKIKEQEKQFQKTY
jgi:hypothetical protein